MENRKIKKKKKKSASRHFFVAAAAREIASLLIRAKERERERENTWLPKKKNERT